MFQPAPDAPNPGAPGQEVPASPAQPQPPVNAAGMGFSPATPLFKPLAGESVQPAAVSMSPFGAQSLASTGAPLTVGDVLPQLPPELVRANALSPDQPVAVSPQVLDAALKSGQAALPIFEIFRVCPALFQVPVAPQDPRMVPLPASKLPRLIASAQQAGGAGQPPTQPQPFSVPASPFASVQPIASQPQSGASGSSPFAVPGAAPAPAASPFQAGGGTLLPPRRNGPPPPLADISGREAAQPSLSLPGTPSAGASPFSTAGPAAAAPGSLFKPAAPPATVSPSPFAPASPSPFAAQAPPAAPVSQPQGLFQPFAPVGNPPSTTVAAGSPFAASQGASAPVSPFSAFSPAPAPSAPGSAEPASVSSPSQPQVPMGEGVTLGGLFSTAKAQVPAASEPAQAQAVFTPAPQATPAVQPPASAFPPGSFGMSPPPVSPTGPSLRIGLAGLLRGYSVAELGFDPVMVPAWIMTSQSAAKVREWATTPNSLAELGMLLDGITDIGFRTVLNNAKRDFLVRIPQEEMGIALASSASAAAPPPAPSSQGQPGMLRINPAEPPAAASTNPVPPPPPWAEAQVVVETKPEPTAPPAYNTVEFGNQGASVVIPQEGDESGPTASPFMMPAGGGHGPQEMVSAPGQSAAVPFSSSRQEHTPRIDPFAPALSSVSPESAFGMPMASHASEGFSSAELLGGLPEAVPPAPAIPVTNPFTGKSSTQVVDVPEEAPRAPEPAAPPAPASLPKAPEPPPMSPASSFSGPFGGSKPTGMPALGIRSEAGNPDQILLRALLGTDDDLTPQRVVEMVCGLPGIAACVCLHNGQALSHVGAHKPQAREFQRQATDLAQHLRTLAPLIGIEGAETFTLTSGDRLMTFCFPEHAILGVLHDAEPSLGLRDKITLIGRELARMLG